jgi:hypothetical protein
MEGQGGQLLTTSTFYDERYGEGTFSHSVYRLGDRLPDWVTKLVPANALVIDEKTWATFPYLRTVMTCPFFSKVGAWNPNQFLNVCLWSERLLKSITGKGT